jgi:uncharacterized Tic20 family protein
MAVKSKDDIFAAAKKYTNKKTGLSILSFILVLAVAVLSAIPEFMINPSQIATSKFVTKLIMSLIIGVTSLICFVMIGGNNNALNEASEIYKARMGFRESVTKIFPEYNRFKQWIEVKRRPLKQKEVYERILHTIGISNMHYLDLEITELKNLVTAPDMDLAKKYGIRQITQEQCDVILGIKTGKYVLKFLDVNDFLYEKTIGINETDEEMLAKQYKKRTLMFTESISSKILVTVVVSVVLGVIGWSTAGNLGEEMTTAQRVFTILWDVLSKLVTAALSAMMGYFDGGRYNDFDARYLQIKTNVHIQYFSDKDFVAKTEKELAMDEFIEYHKQQDEEERKRLGLSAHVLPPPKN